MGLPDLGDETLRQVRAILDQQDLPIGPAVQHGTVQETGVQPEARRRFGAFPQFVDDELQPGERANARDERNLVDRFRQEIVGSGFESFHPITRLIERRHQDDRDMRGRGIVLETAADVEAIHPRHHDVEQNHIERRTSTDLQGLEPVARRTDLEIFSGETRFQQSHVGKNVVHDQDSCRHRSASYPSPR